MTPHETMSSVHQWAWSKRPLAAELGVDPCDGVPFSWSGIKLFVELAIDTSWGDVENVEAVSKIADDVIQPSKDPQDATNEPGGTQVPSFPQHDDSEAIKSSLLENHGNDEQECDKQQTSEVKQCGVEDERDRSCTHCAWPDWGEPLPPEEDEDDMNVDYSPQFENHQPAKKVVTFCDVISVVEPTCLQEERETGSFSYAGSSDDELDQGTEQVTSSSDGNSIHLSPSPVFSKEEEAACHLLELGNELNCRNLKVKGFESSEASGRGQDKSYDPNHDLEKLSELLEKLYATSPGLSIVSGSLDSVSSEEVGTWTIEVSKDSRRIKMKRIKHEVLDDDNDVLERPPWKRQYKSLRKLS